MDFWQYFHGPNAGYLIDQYDRFRSNPESVSDELQALFEQWTPPTNGHTTPIISAELTFAELFKAVAAVRYAKSIRAVGHLGARLDPLGTPPPGDPNLQVSTHRISDDDLSTLPAAIIKSPISAHSTTALDVIQGLRQVYTSTLGHDWDHVHNPVEREWLKEAAETRRFHPDTLPIDGRALLERLTEIETLELFLHRTFPGKYRFSIEGLDMLVPILDVMIDEAAADNYEDVSIGMAHRGRLNVMAHILNKPYQDILVEFKDAVISNNNKLEDQFGYLGDVKYHKSIDRELASLRVRMPANPSHLEAVNAVAIGMGRAAESIVNQGGAPAFNHRKALTILIHGDAAFTGQGSVAETLNLANLPGYRTGGTLHIIANNQIGFTTLPSDSRSTYYASDPAKGYDIPILHVNADDPEACIEAARFAYAYHREFQKDFVIDLIGYRRYGHNELDEPEYTQPVLYEKVKNHPRVRQHWATTLLQREEVRQEEPDELVTEHEQQLQNIYESLTDEDLLPRALPFAAPPGRAAQAVTGVRADTLIEINEALGQYPEGFQVHRKLVRTLKARRDAIHSDDPAIDWATAEELAFATILADAIPIRLTGQDVERGTFSQRHAVLHDAVTGERMVPLQRLPQARAAFEIYNSPLSENAALAYEYGYNVQAPNRLVLWEAQFGDFVNNAQVVIDEFICSANIKWNQTVSLVLLLPHGNEGKGPDHSSARLERFLQLAAKKNMRIAYCTRASQYFHLLRRQALLLESDPLPLVVMTPKSLLRHPLVYSSMDELVNGRWLPVIDDRYNEDEAKAVTRLIFCTGKVYVDLVTSEFRETDKHVAIARVEQLYPLPVRELTQVIQRYPNLEQVVWVQEEPKNMGAWEYIGWRLARLLRKSGHNLPVRYVGRTRSSSPAEGSTETYKKNQATVVEYAFRWQEWKEEN